LLSVSLQKSVESDGLKRFFIPHFHTTKIALAGVLN